jgi:hypothetical protein
MLHHENGDRRHKRWSEWSPGAKAGVIAAAVVLVPGLLALFSAVTMWLWNWLMPAIFKLPAIGFWQAVGILLLSHILFKGGYRWRAGSRLGGPDRSPRALPRGESERRGITL